MNSPICIHHTEALCLEHNTPTTVKNIASGITTCKLQQINK